MSSPPPNQNQPQQQQQPINTNANIVPPIEKSAWQKYLDDLGEVKQRVIEQLAPRESYDIPLLDGSKKTYKRKRISTKRFFEAERLRAKFMKETDVEKSTDIMIDLYLMVAKDGLIDPETNQPMTEEEFENTEWEDSTDQPGIKIILDTIAHRSVHGGAFFLQRPPMVV